LCNEINGNNFIYLKIYSLLIAETPAKKKYKANHKKESKPKKAKCRGTWNHQQKTMMLQYFKTNVKNKISPKKDECLKLREDHLDLFKDKNWVQIKVFIYNTYKNN
jgi:hypothetical protein